MRGILNGLVETDLIKELTVSPGCTIKITQERTQSDIPELVVRDL